MRTRFRNEDDRWTLDGQKISDVKNLATIKQEIETQGPVILEHWFYRGSCSPDRYIFDDFDELVSYLNDHSFAGDSIHIWSFATTCTQENELASGKCPDENGLVPSRGAY
ncbi:MAG: hypothetical protein J0M26_00680 [Planctomycetes bacterium]|nr:hypothetical protein [Planctomycetota bacterium]